jgi:hypothetical protein
MTPSMVVAFQTLSTLAHAKGHCLMLARMARHRFLPVTNSTATGDAAVVNSKCDAADHLHVVFSVSPRGALSVDLGVGASSVSRETNGLCGGKARVGGVDRSKDSLRAS